MNRDEILSRMSEMKWEMYQLRLNLEKLEDCHSELPNLKEEILKTTKTMDSINHKLLKFIESE
jgi:hypothetical protein